MIMAALDALVSASESRKENCTFCFVSCTLCCNICPKNLFIEKIYSSKIFCIFSFGWKFFYNKKGKFTATVFS